MEKSIKLTSLNRKEALRYLGYKKNAPDERVGKDRLDYVVESLKDGKLVVEICEAYTITGGSSGHFIVLTGVTADGYITIADCASRERTGKLYSVETIKSYGRDLSEGAFWIIGK